MMITEAWTGNPSFDFVSPAVAENVDAIPGTYTNAVVWDDVPGEFGEVYDVYASVVLPLLQVVLTHFKLHVVVALGVAEGTQEAYHDITVPLADNTSWYYAVVATDAAGNKSKVAGMTSAVSNVGKRYSNYFA